MLNRLLLVLGLVLGLAGAVYAADSQSLYRVPGDAVVGESNSTASMVPILTVVSGVANDTGAEVCADIQMDCHDVVVLAEAGGSGDEIVASTCATDNADASLTISYCY